MLDAGIERKIEDFYWWIDGTGWAWEYLGEATGEVSVPPGKKLALQLNKASGRDLSPLKELQANDLYKLDLSETADSNCLSQLSTLTGLKVLSFPRALGGRPVYKFTAQDLKQLSPLKSLERLTAPEQIDDQGLAAIVNSLPQLKGLYIKKNELLDSGLVALSRLKALEELEIGGGKTAGSGLNALSDLPILHYLSLWSPPNTNALRAVRKISSLKTFKARNR